MLSRFSWKTSDSFLASFPFHFVVCISLNNHGGAPRPCGEQPKAAPLLSWFCVLFFHIWVIILAIRMITLAGRMKRLYHPVLASC